MENPVSVSGRLASFLASLLFSLPTAFLLWFGLNRELALIGGGFLSSAWLWGTILVFAIASIVSPSLFISMLAMLWNGIYRIAKWI